MHSLNPLRTVPHNIRLFSTSLGLSAKNHYDVLGITPKATQGDVKAAYYKLSMVYHPDKNEGSESASEKFRDITAAYEVLGNIKLRKLYDKGVFHINMNPTQDSPTHNFYKSREHRTRHPMSGRTPIYDFDEWSKSHYGATFARDMERKRKAAFHQNLNFQERRDAKTRHIVGIVGLFILAMMYFSYDARESVDNVLIVNDSITTVSRQGPKID